METLEKALNDLTITLKQSMEACGEKVIEVSELLIQTFKAGDKLLICGNGGSAADAQHIAAEFVNRFRFDRPPLPAIALTTDTSILTSISNDSSYDEIFSRQVLALGRPGDMLLAITTSGKSPNILKAIKAAREKEMKTVLLTGRVDKSLHSISDIVIDVQSQDTPRIQETHIFFAHLLCEMVEKRLFKEG